MVSAPNTTNETVTNNNNLQHSSDTASNISHVTRIPPITVSEKSDSDSGLCEVDVIWMYFLGAMVTG